jgi:hypothetical protein
MFIVNVNGRSLPMEEKIQIIVYRRLGETLAPPGRSKCDSEATPAATLQTLPYHRIPSPRRRRWHSWSTGGGALLLRFPSAHASTTPCSPSPLGRRPVGAPCASATARSHAWLLASSHEVAFLVAYHLFAPAVRPSIPVSGAPLCVPQLPLQLLPPRPLGWASCSSWWLWPAHLDAAFLQIDGALLRASR